MSPISNAKVRSQSQCVQIRQMEEYAVKISASSKVNGKKSAVRISVQIR
jgi:hypothetical protein